MNIIIIPLILAPFGLWLYAEFKLGRGARIILGLVSIICSGFLVYANCQIRHDYESAWHQASILVATEELKRGQTNRVISAFETYSSIAATDSTFRASEQMIHSLYGNIQNKQTPTREPNHQRIESTGARVGGP